MQIKPDFSDLYEINGHNLHLELYGPEDALSIVFLHHGLGSTRSWKNQLSPFLKAGYRLVLYDRWGYGQSDPRFSTSIPEFKEDIADLEMVCSSLSLRSCVLVGHSDGGTIALMFAARNQDKVAALVSTAAHIYIEPKMVGAISVVRNTFVCDSHFQSGLQRVHGEKYQLVFYNWFNGWHRDSNLEWNLLSDLGTIRCPALVIQGLNDEHATPQHARDISSAIVGSELCLAPDAGHMVPQENSDMFNSRVVAFLESITNFAKP
jgi:pimeloyl-ACP methyl ester carboxylesterase